ncbi:MAG: hypothetical protein IPK33_14350 [Gemmatimonadetes bacterium]|nr:hypothetical protein [Gemmatimonadota bacterium]MBK8649526.1 hypothetical protein [Gemmatimonadota bacterium]
MSRRTLFGTDAEKEGAVAEHIACGEYRSIELSPPGWGRLRTSTRSIDTIAR